MGGLVGHCTNCGSQTLVTPLHGDNGGPLFCLHCGIDWHTKNARLRKMGRIVSKAMKAFFAAGGTYTAIDRLSLSACGFSLYPGEAYTLETSLGDITTELLEAAVRLTHPDRHPPERQAEAHRVTQELLALKLYTFPAPKPKPRSKAEPEPTAANQRKQRIDQLTNEITEKASRYPCEICVDQTPFFYCATCSAEYDRRQHQEHERKRRKRREQYARRKQRLQWKTPPRTCPSCGDSFKGKRHDAVYCSSICRQRAHRKRVTDNLPPSRAAQKSRDAARGVEIQP